MILKMVAYILDLTLHERLNYKIMKTLFIGLSLLFGGYMAQSQIMQMEESEVKFYSYTVLEDIEAVTKSAKGLINYEDESFYFEIPIITFDFEKDLMEEHFNENYMETEEYPTATFEGKITSDINLDSDGTYIFSGDLTIHGRTQKRDIEVTIKKDESGNISLNSEFKVKLVDHKIKIPKVVFANIAEIIDVTIKGNLVEYKK